MGTHKYNQIINLNKQAMKNENSQKKTSILGMQCLKEKAITENHKEGRKKILLINKLAILISFALFPLFTQAQFDIGIKIDANFSRLNTGSMDYGTDLKALLCPGVHLTGLLYGVNWAWIIEMGYSANGFKEFDDRDHYKIKTNNFDFIQGVQYSFLDDWASVRPILQARIGMRLRLGDGEITRNGEKGQLYADDSSIDVPWSIGAGVRINKIATTINYGGGLLDYIKYESGWRHKQTQLSLILYF
jgi:hypothetical protein